MPGRGLRDPLQNPAMTNAIANMEKQLEQAKKDGDEKKIKISNLLHFPCMLTKLRT